MKLYKRQTSPYQSLIESNITDWRLLIQHPNTGKSNDSESAEIVTEKSRPGPTRIQYGEQLIPLYCTILGLLIVCLIGYVIYKILKQKNNSSQCTAIISKGNSGNSLRLPKYSPSSKSDDNKEMTSLVKSTDGMRESQFEHYFMNQPLYSLPEDHIEAIVFSLSDDSSGNGWIHLAQYYNINQEEIDSMLQYNDKIDTVRLFLKKLAENPNHTLKKLIKSLQEISRPDTVFLIKSSLRKFSQKSISNNEFPNKESNNNLLISGSQNNGNAIIHT